MRGFFLTVLFLVFMAVAACGLSFYQWRTPFVMTDTTIVITPGSGTRAILHQLANAQVTPPSWQLTLPLVLSAQIPSLKAGEYLFTAGMSPEQVIAKIARGQVVIHKLTMPEGWNSFQLRTALLAEPLLTGDVPTIAEGSVFPDTMLFQRGQSRASIVTAMQQRMRDALAAAWAGRDPAVALRSPEEALILASVVEKETGVAEERPIIAGVFYNRLKKGMKLQSDPTVAYGIEVAQEGAPLARALTSADLQTDTPFNSYTREGLPPTPICSPGAAALQAVLHPAATDAFYFVATGYGGHHFSSTLESHNSNVSRYRRVLEEASKQSGVPQTPSPHVQQK